jgi:2-isopropylmalate synthase
MSDHITLYDSTLRDGSQSMGVDFNLADKQVIARALDALGLDYLEGGWPGANPVDDAFFAAAPALSHTRLTAFGMTCRAGKAAQEDTGLRTLLDTPVKALCIVGKAWDFQVDEALRIPREENLRMIRDSVSFLVEQGREVLFDAEHFFDGFRSNPDYALTCIRTAFDAGARWIVLCDTNGGSQPFDVAEVVSSLTRHIPGTHLGIHCHNDTEQAVANSLAAVRAGARQVQGTINGVGERCGNANLISIIPTLMLKLGFTTGIAPEKLPQLTTISRLLDDRLNRSPNPHAAYVGEAAFAHKGGLHVSAVARVKSAYEHIDPALVGNRTNILISDKAGRSNILAQLETLGLKVEASDPRVEELVALVKTREQDGFAYEGAEASFALVARRLLGEVPEFFDLESFRVLDERRINAKGKLETVSEATIKLRIGKKRMLTVAEGNGPVNALDAALRKALARFYPVLKDIRLVDYKVRILTPQDGTKAVTRVMIESSDGEGNRWRTIGVSANVIDASYHALHDSITTVLLRP